MSLFCVLPLAVGKSGWNSPPKLFCVFLALGAVRTFLMQDGKWTRQDEEASLARGTSKYSPQCIVVQVSKCFKMP